MSPQAIFCGLAALVCLYLVYLCLKEGLSSTSDALVFTAIVVLTGVFGSCSYQGTTPEHLAEIEAERKAQLRAEAEERKPRLYSRANGCEVYTFKGNGRWQFFTKCPGSVTNTETNWEECTTYTVGKTQQRRCEVKTSNIESR